METSFDMSERVTKLSEGTHVADRCSLGAETYSALVKLLHGRERDEEAKLIILGKLSVLYFEDSEFATWSRDRC